MRLSEYMLLSEANATSMQEIRNRFEAAFPTEKEPNKMSSKELFNLIKILYNNQANIERQNSSVIYRNGVGFSITDSCILTDFYNFYVKHKYYTKEQKVTIGKILRKHCIQLINHWISAGKINKLGRGKYSYESKAERLAKAAEIQNKQYMTQYGQQLDLFSDL